MRGHDPHAVDGRRAKGELGTSRHADGAGARRLRPLHARNAPQPARSRLAGSRPVRALRRARLDAAVLDAVPGGLRREPRGGHHALPPARVACGGTSRVRAPARHRGHHRTARAGDLARRRDGASGADAGREVQPRRSRCRRSPHVRDRLRRGHRGGDLQRGLVTRRPPRARAPHRFLRP